MIDYHFYFNKSFTNFNCCFFPHHLIICNYSKSWRFTIIVSLPSVSSIMRSTLKRWRCCTIIVTSQKTDQSGRGNGQKCRRNTGTSDSTEKIVLSARKTSFVKFGNQNSTNPTCYWWENIEQIVRMASVVAPSKVEFIVGGKYRLVRKIGSGSFGDIYLGINVTNGEVNN